LHGNTENVSDVVNMGDVFRVNTWMDQNQKEKSVKKSTYARPPREEKRSKSDLSLLKVYL
jgi:hypothetical protein